MVLVKSQRGKVTCPKCSSPDFKPVLDAILVIEDSGRVTEMSGYHCPWCCKAYITTKAMELFRDLDPSESDDSPEAS